MRAHHHFALRYPGPATPSRHVARLLTLWAAVALAACATGPGVTPMPSVQPSGRASAQSASWPGAAGAGSSHWDGSYRGAAGPQGGPLTLRLGGGGAGTGEVTWRARPRSDVGPGARRAASVPVTVLLTAVRVDAGRVVLVTDAYFDPTCDCTVRSTFTGAVRGDTLAGRFVTRGAATTADTRGRWHTVRRSDSPASTARTLADDGPAGRRAARVP